MALMNLKTLKEKSKQNDVRKMVMPLGIWKKIWIPKDELLYHRIHFGVKKYFTTAKYDVIDCFNQEYGQSGKGCPICAIIDEKWAEWRGTKDVAIKKQLQNEINRLVSEEFLVNAIDLEDDEMKFYAIRFTKGKLADLQLIQDTKGIPNVLWRYRKKDTNGKTEYELVDDENDEMIAKLRKDLPGYLEREEEAGGLVDLERIIRKHGSLDEFKKLLEGGSEDEDDGKEVEKETKKTIVKKTTAPKVELEESASLDTLDLPDMDVPEKKPETKKAEKKPETKKEEDVENMDLSDLGLAPLDLDTPEEKKPEVLADLTAEFVNEKRADTAMIASLCNLAFEKGWITDSKDYVTNLKALFAYVKSKGKVEVPALLISAPF